MKDYFISKIRNLIERYLEGYLQSEELVVLLEDLEQKYYDKDKLKKINAELVKDFDDFFEDVSYFEPHQEIRKESKMYFGEEKLKRLAIGLLGKIKN